MSEQRKYPEKKEQMISKIVSLSQGHRYLCLAKLQKVRSVQLMMLRKILKKDAKFIVVKNRVALKALKKANFKGIDQMEDKFTGQLLLIFTDQNPFKLTLFLSKNKVSLQAKAGDIAMDEIFVPAGNTGLAPGPVLSEFKEANVATRIDSGSIWIAKDTVVAKEGDTISPKLAGLLNRLNIKPIKAGLSISFSMIDGVLLKENELILNIEQFFKDIQKAFSEAKSLAINVNYFTEDDIREILSKAYLEAQNLAINSDYISEDDIKQLLAKYENKAKTLYEIVKEKGYN